MSMHQILTTILNNEMILYGIEDPCIMDKSVYKEVLVILDTNDYKNEIIRTKMKAFLYIYKEIESVYQAIYEKLKGVFFLSNVKHRKIAAERVLAVKWDIDQLIHTEERHLKLDAIKQRLRFWIFSLEH